ncbi:MAG: shikimate dehydrogenase [Bacteroidaceae bacterium]|nr:shikimate dehydrogenase [Bacteroidaceae bacterium]
MNKYGLIGYPLGHSFSKRFFTEKFAREGIDACYDNYEIEDAQMLLDVVRQNPELRGLNCTIPHKQAIMPLLDSISQEAREIGAVNVIRIRRNETGAPTLEGFNSDVVGFRESIKPLLEHKHRKALVLGTGGASKAICYALTQLGLEWKLVSRSKRGDNFTYDELTADILRQYTVIVNCSPVGMHPHTDEAPQLPYEAIGPQHLLFDLIYNPTETLFLKRGRERGAVTKNGLEMLELQALESWRIWNST